jgi:predicted RNA-binding protein with EMAP domain
MYYYSLFAFQIRCTHRLKELEMTELLEQAVLKISQLPPIKQNAIATMILEELDDEAQWETAFAYSQDKLTKLAEKTREDIKRGRVKKMGFDEL